MAFLSSYYDKFILHDLFYHILNRLIIA
jgi:hypothetical protein